MLSWSVISVALIRLNIFNQLIKYFFRELISEVLIKFHCIRAAVAVIKYFYSNIELIVCLGLLKQLISTLIKLDWTHLDYQIKKKKKIVGDN